MVDDTRPRPRGVTEEEGPASLAEAVERGSGPWSRGGPSSVHLLCRRPLVDRRPVMAEISADEVVARLRAEVVDLRLRLEAEVRTRRVVIIDDRGAPRIRLTATADGDSQVALLDADGFERMQLTGRPDGGSVSVAARPSGDDLTHVEVFALDADEGDGPYVGVELIDRGASVAGFALYEGRAPRTWTADR